MARTWTTPIDFTAVTTPGGTGFNEQVRDNITFLARPSILVATLSSDHTFSTTDPEQLTWGSASINTDSVTVGANLEIPSGWDGYWSLSGQAAFNVTSSGGAGDGRVQIRRNATVVTEVRAPLPDDRQLRWSLPCPARVVECVAGDDISMYVERSGTSVPSVESDADETFICLQFVGRSTS